MGTIDAIIGMDLQRSRYRGIICASEVCPNIANCAFRLLFRLRGHDYTNELKSSDRIDFSPRFPSSSRDINSSLFHEWRKEDEEVIPLNWSHKHYVVSYIPHNRRDTVVILSWYCRERLLSVPYCQFKSLWIGVKRIAYCVVARLRSCKHAIPRRWKSTWILLCIYSYLYSTRY